MEKIFVNTVKLAEGVRLRTIQTDKFKTNMLTVSLLTALNKEEASLNSLLTDVLRRACKKYPTLMSFNAYAEDLYAAAVDAYVQKKGEIQLISFPAVCIDNAYTYDKCDLFDKMTELLGEMIFNPLVSDGAFNAEYVESEKKNLCDEIAAQIDNKTSYAIKRGYEEMCRGEAFSVAHGGEIEAVKKITPQELYSQYLKLMDSANVEIFYIGSLDINTVAECVKKHLPFTPRKEVMLNTCVISDVGEVKEVVEQMPVNQGKLSIGFRTGCVLGADNYSHFSLFNEIFGGATTSKLFMNVREKMSLCYYCRPIAEALKGVLLVASGINSADKEKAQAAILQQLTDIQEGKITDKEFESAKKSLINAYNEIYDSYGAIANWYMTRTLAGIYTSPSDAASDVEKATKQDVINIAKKVKLDTVYFLKGVE